MIWFLSIVFFVVFIVIDINMAAKMRVVVSQKGYDPDILHIFAWCFWLPIFGYLYVIALPDLRLQAQNNEIISKLGSKAETESTEEEPIQLPDL